MSAASRLGVGTNRKHQLDPAKIVQTAENLAHRVSERLPESNLAGLAAELAGIARETHRRARQVRRPIYLVRAACGLAILASLTALWYLVSDIHTRWVFGTITEVFEAADAGFNLLVLLAGALWFLITIEFRVKRRKTLDFLEELLEFIQVIDVTHLYYSPELYGETRSSSRSSLQFDHTYLLFCTEMLALIRNLAPLYARGNVSDSIWRAVSEVVMLANAIEDRLFSKAEAVRVVAAAG
jgi:hypothetical protein